MTRRSSPVKWLWVAAGSLAVVLILGAIVLLTGNPASDNPASDTVTGGLIILGDCDSAGYSDIGNGTPVVLYGDGGAELDRSRLGGAGHCSYTFELDAPEGHDLYTVSIGDRGELVRTWDELHELGKMTFTLGSF